MSAAAPLLPPLFGLPGGAAGHAVVVSPHPAGGGGDGDLAFWAETLLAWLQESGRRTTLLVPVLAEEEPETLSATPPPSAEGVRVVAAEDPRALALAVDGALRDLAPDLVHAPERGGTLLAALSSRAAGLAHAATRFVLHARGPSRFREEERARFLSDPAQLLLDAQERRAAAMADAFLVACPGVAAWLAEEGWPAATPVAPLLWRFAAGEAAPGDDTPWELVVPGPLDSAEGLEFLVEAARRAAPRGPAWRLAFLGEPGEVTLDDPARLLASLGAAAAWSAPRAARPGEVVARLAKPRRALLLGGRRAAPPELVAACAAAGVPVLGRAGPALEAWAARHPGRVEALPAAERPFAKALAAWAGPPPSAAPAVAPAAEAPGPPDAWLAPAAPVAPPPPRPVGAPPSVTLLLPEGPPAAAARARRQALALAEFPEPPEVATGRAPEGAGLVLGLGRAEAPRKDLVPVLREALRRSGCPVVTSLPGPGALPLGCDADIAFLDPGAALGEVVLLDAEACRARGEAGLRALAALGTEELPAALAEAGLPVLAVPLLLHEPLPPRRAGAELRRSRAAPALPPELRDALRLLIPADEEEPRRDPLPEAEAELLAAALDREEERGSDVYLRALGRLLDRLGLPEAALDAWEAVLARAAGDGEALLRRAVLRLRLHGEEPGADALARLRGPAGLWTLRPEIREALERDGPEGLALLARLEEGE